MSFSSTYCFVEGMKKVACLLDSSVKVKQEVEVIHQCFDYSSSSEVHSNRMMNRQERNYQEEAGVASRHFLLNVSIIFFLPISDTHTRSLHST